MTATAIKQQAERSAGQGLYIGLLSIHGLIRGKSLELGRDPDTGGQTKYVIELTRALAAHPDVSRVDLFTRRIVDAEVSPDYAAEEEDLCPGARIIRIDCGPPGYIPKEQLWDHIDSFADNLQDWFTQRDTSPDILHGHYADAGYVGARLSHLLGVPLVFTAHSLGRDKRKQLLAQGLSREEIEQSYNIARRIDAEEEVLASADLVITSTQNEIERQYGLYNYYDPGRMRVIPPGTDLKKFRPYAPDEKISFSNTLDRFLTDPEKPLILALSRPDERKNILTLVEAFGESQALQESANLCIVAGNREDIREMDQKPQSVLTNILLLIDAYDLYGKVAIPKRHEPTEVPEIYRLAASRKGVFINPALTEPFGLTLLEAAASGLPVVATENGGPVDIIQNCQCGLLVDPLDKTEMTEALLHILRDPETWQQASDKGIAGVREHYSWQAHANAYLEKLLALQQRVEPDTPQSALPRTMRYRDRMVVTSIDNNLLGDIPSLSQLVAMVKDKRKVISFGIATARRIDSALAILRKYDVPRPDVLISSLGTRIYYGENLTEDDWWTDHIDHNWSPKKIRRVLDELPGLTLRPEKEQSAEKISYLYDADSAAEIEEIITLLRQQELTANTFLSFGKYLDIVPIRASKGQALRYVAQRLDIALDNVLVAGGSGVDEDMMRGNTLAVVVANRHHELSLLPEEDNIFHASRDYAAGILEALDHYDFFAEHSDADA